jgi:hypothetical protein
MPVSESLKSHKPGLRSRKPGEVDVGALASLACDASINDCDVRQLSCQLVVRSATDSSIRFGHQLADLEACTQLVNTGPAVCRAR